MVYENDKSRDFNEPSKRLYPSEVGWQTFMMATREDGPRVYSTNIRAILNYYIINDEVLQVLYWGHRNSHSARDGGNGHREYSETDDGFYAVLGSALGACNMRMLLDHKSRTGYRIVDRVVVLGDDLGPEFCRGRSFMIIMSEKRERPSRMVRSPHQVDMKRYLSHKVRQDWIPPPQSRKATRIASPINFFGPISLLSSRIIYRITGKQVLLW